MEDRVQTQSVESVVDGDEQDEASLSVESGPQGEDQEATSPEPVSEMEPGEGLTQESPAGEDSTTSCGSFPW